MNNITIDYLNRVRDEKDFMTLDELEKLMKTNIIIDIFSLLILKNINIGDQNVFYPNVVICSGINGKIAIGDTNTFYTGCYIKAINETITIGNENEIGEGGCFIKTSGTGITIADKCRVMNNPQILDGCKLGKGSQVLGNLKINNCVLEDGESYKEPNPNKRGGVIKGFGIGSGLQIGKGKVIFGKGIINQEQIEDQENYHRDWKAGKEGK